MEDRSSEVAVAGVQRPSNAPAKSTAPFSDVGTVAEALEFREAEQKAIKNFVGSAPSPTP